MPVTRHVILLEIIQDRSSPSIQETQQDKQGKVASCKLHIKSEPSTRSDLANVKNKFIKAEQCSNPQEHKAQIDADK
jgi:hypothetical protein